LRLKEELAISCAPLAHPSLSPISDSLLRERVMEFVVGAEKRLDWRLWKAGRAGIKPAPTHSIVAWRRQLQSNKKRSRLGNVSCPSCSSKIAKAGPKARGFGCGNQAFPPPISDSLLGERVMEFVVGAEKRLDWRLWKAGWAGIKPAYTQRKHQ
jgi:hypothetical protein